MVRAKSFHTLIRWFVDSITHRILVHIPHERNSCTCTPTSNIFWLLPLRPYGVIVATPNIFWQRKNNLRQSSLCHVMCVHSEATPSTWCPSRFKLTGINNLTQRDSGVKCHPVFRKGIDEPTVDEPNDLRTERWWTDRPSCYHPWLQWFHQKM